MQYYVKKMHCLHLYCTHGRVEEAKCVYSAGWGPSRSLEMSPFDRTHMTSYRRSIVTMALYRVVSEIFNVQKCRVLEFTLELGIVTSTTVQ